MKTYRQQITSIYGTPIAVVSGTLSSAKNSNCYAAAKRVGFDCFAVAGERAGKNRTEGYVIYFFRGTHQEGPAFRGIIQY